MGKLKSGVHTKMRQDKERAMSILIGMIVLMTAALLLFRVSGVGAGFRTQAEEPIVGSESLFATPGDAASPDDAALNTATPLDAENSPLNQENTEENTEADSSEEVTEAEASTEDSTEFEVPDTSLPDVEDITGNDWFDESKFQYISPVADSYFDDTVFIGDSRTEGLALYGGQKNMNSFSYKGLSVDKVSTEKCISLNGAKYTVEEAINMTNYSNYYIQFGVNELGWIYVDKFTQGVSDLVDLIQAHNPDAIIYVSGIAPVSEEISSTDAVFNRDNVLKFNDALYEMCQQRGDVIYLDLGASVSDSQGYLPTEGTTDGKHCNAAYCKRMVKYIRTHAVERVE
jgi:lysophospholipase L1-like esterase